MEGWESGEREREGGVKGWEWGERGGGGEREEGVGGRERGGGRERAGEREGESNIITFSKYKTEPTFFRFPA